MKKLFITTAIAGALFATSCSKSGNNSNTPTDGTAKVQLVLTDAPSLRYDAIFLDIREVAINTGGEKDNWVKYPIDPVFAKPLNILDYRNGKVIAMGDPLSLPAGKIQQIRLILGDNNTIVVDGKTERLTVPSGQQSGIKVNLHKELLPDGVYKIWIDFDAAQSIKVHQTGNGKYMMRPVVRAFADETNGQIRGMLGSATALDIARPVVYVLKGVDTLGSALPAPDGFFHFVGLPAGNGYSLSVDAIDATGYKDVRVNDISVVFGKVTEVGPITLSK